MTRLPVSNSYASRIVDLIEGLGRNAEVSGVKSEASHILAESLANLTINGKPALTLAPSDRGSTMSLRTLFQPGTWPTRRNLVRHLSKVIDQLIDEGRLRIRYANCSLVLPSGEEVRFYVIRVT